MMLLKSIFNVVQDHFCYPFRAPILGPDLPKKQPRWAQEGHQELQNQKTAFSKPLKNHQFFNILGSKDLPRETQEAQEGSQEASKELQNLKKS